MSYAREVEVSPAVTEITSDPSAPAGDLLEVRRSRTRQGCSA